MQTVTLKRLSICKCGFLALDDSIPLGTEYQIEPAMRAPATFVCGGCKAAFEIECVFTYGRGQSHGGMMPLGIFEPQN